MNIIAIMFAASIHMPTTSAYPFPSHFLPLPHCSSCPPSSSSLDSPLPLEATPLPSLLSPKLAIPLENGVTTDDQKLGQLLEEEEEEEQKEEVVSEQPAGSPPPTNALVLAPSSLPPTKVPPMESEFLDINQLLQGPLKSVLTEKAVAGQESR